MKQQVPLTRETYSKPQYERTINTSFTQLGVSTQANTVILPTVDEFFKYYNELFFQIPKYGALNSHEYLIEQSSTYVGEQQQLEEIKALQDEIAELRKQLLDSRSDAINTIADVLDESGLNLPALPEIPNIEVPSEFSFDIPTDNPQEEQTRREKRKTRREERRKKRQERRNN